MSDHLQEKHNIKDQYKESIERLTEIQNSLKDDDFKKENGLYHCTKPNCEYSTRWILCFHNNEGNGFVTNVMSPTSYRPINCRR